MKILTSTTSKHLISLILADAAFFGWTNAAVVPSFMLIIGFLLVTATVYYLIYGLLGLARLYGVKVKKRPVALYLTLLLSGLIALQSTGQLSQRDLVVLAPLCLLAYFYSVYAKAARRNLES